MQILANNLKKKKKITQQEITKRKPSKRLYLWSFFYMKILYIKYLRR